MGWPQSRPISSRRPEFGLVEDSEPAPVWLLAGDLHANTGAILGRCGGQGEVTADQGGQRFLARRAPLSRAPLRARL
jgi:hypothetical protein